MSDFSLEKKYQFYLQKVGLNEKTMGRAEAIERKRSFFAGYGMALESMLNDVNSLPEAQAMQAIDSMVNEAKQFWGNQL